MGASVTAEAPQVNPRTEAVAIGIDVGSTTVKAVVVDPDHEGDPLERLPAPPDQAGREGARVPGAHRRRVPEPPAGRDPHLHHRLGRSARSAAHIGVEVRPGGQRGHAGGRDAAPRRRLGVSSSAARTPRSSSSRRTRRPGDKTAIASMNDKCASGTGATIDKCLIKVGLPDEEVVKLGFDDSKLHHVAAKCGVFAETDIVNLVKTGIPSLEIMSSLADAIVMQNLSVLTRGNTLRHKVLLLGGPNTYLPFLQDCWRKRIPRDLGRARLRLPEGRADRGADHRPGERAVLRGVRRGDVRPARGRPRSASTRASTALERVHHQRPQGAGSARPPARRCSPGARPSSRATFRELYTIPKFDDATFEPGQVRRGRHRPRRRLDVVEGRARSTRDGELLKKAYQLSKGNPIQDTKEILARPQDSASPTRARPWRCIGFGATGYAADVLEESCRVRRQHRRDRRAHDVRRRTTSATSTSSATSAGRTSRSCS